VKKQIAASQGFRSVDAGLSTIARYEAMNMIGKGQIRWLPKGEVVGQKRFIETNCLGWRPDLLRQFSPYPFISAICHMCDTAVRPAMVLRLRCRG